MNFKKILIIIFLFISPFSFADEEADPGFGGGSGDPATEPVQTPIDGITLPLLVTGILTAIVVIRKQQRHSNC